MTSASGGDEAIARHREIIDLIYYHEKSVDDCALILGIPAATVKTRMFLRPQEVGGAGPAGGALATAPDLGRGRRLWRKSARASVPSNASTPVWRSGHAQEIFGTINQVFRWDLNLAGARPPARTAKLSKPRCPPGGALLLEPPARQLFGGTKRPQVRFRSDCAMQGKIAGQRS